MVLDEGEAKEIGNHASLMAAGGIYKDMFEKQQLEAAIGDKRRALQHSQVPDYASRRLFANHVGKGTGRKAKKGGNPR